MSLFIDWCINVNISYSLHTNAFQLGAYYRPNCYMLHCLLLEQLLRSIISGQNLTEASCNLVSFIYWVPYIAWLPFLDDFVGWNIHLSPQ